MKKIVLLTLTTLNIIALNTHAFELGKKIDEKLTQASNMSTQTSVKAFREFCAFMTNKELSPEEALNPEAATPKLTFDDQIECTSNVITLGLLFATLDASGVPPWGLFGLTLFTYSLMVDQAKQEVALYRETGEFGVTLGLIYTEYLKINSDLSQEEFVSDLDIKLNNI